MEVKKDKQKESQYCSITPFVNNKLKRLSRVVTLDEKEEKYQDKITQIKKSCQVETRNLEKRYQDEFIKIKKSEQENKINIEKRCQEVMRKNEKFSEVEIMKVKETFQELTREIGKMSQDEINKKGKKEYKEIIKSKKMFKKMLPKKIREVEQIVQDRNNEIKDVFQEDIRKIEKIGQEEISNFEKANKDEIQIWERYQDEIDMIKKEFREENMNDLQTRVDQEIVLSRDSTIIMMEKLSQLEEAIYELKLDKDKKNNQMEVKLECFETEKMIKEEIVEQMPSHITYLRKEQFKMKEDMLELVETCQQFEFSFHQTEKSSKNLCNSLKSLNKYVGLRPHCYSDKYDKTCTSEGKTFQNEIKNKHDEEVLTSLISEEASLSEEGVTIHHNGKTTIHCYKQSKLCATVKEFKPKSYNQQTLFKDSSLLFVPRPLI